MIVQLHFCCFYSCKFEYAYNAMKLFKWNKNSSLFSWYNLGHNDNCSFHGTFNFKTTGFKDPVTLINCTQPCCLPWYNLIDIFDDHAYIPSNLNVSYHNTMIYSWYANLHQVSWILLVFPPQCHGFLLDKVWKVMMRSPPLHLTWNVCECKWITSEEMFLNAFTFMQTAELIIDVTHYI